MCRCDAFPVEHADGLVTADAVCELVIPSPTISPHIIRPWWLGIDPPPSMSHGDVLPPARPRA